MSEETTSPPPAEPREPEITAGQFARALLDMLASTRTAVVLLGVIAAVTILGTILPNDIALKYVYGRLWFHVLLGLLALNLAACMVWRRRVGLARAWSLLTHAGILLVLLGALVTLVSSERGYLPLEPGMTSDKFWPQGADMHKHPGEPLGFALRLVDFNVDFYPTGDVLSAWRGDELVAEARLDGDREVELPGTGLRAARPVFTPEEGPGLVEYTAPGGERRSVPADVGTDQKLEGTDLALKILLYLPSLRFFKTKSGRKQIGSESFRPNMPALHVAVVRGGKPERPQWLFAKVPGFGRMHREEDEKQPKGLDLQFMHPACPRLEVDLINSSDRRRVRIDPAEELASPWGDGLVLRQAREPWWKVKDYRSEVEVVEKEDCDDSDGEHRHGEERVVKRHVIRVNSPLVYKGTKFSQSDFDQRAARYTILGVSRDVGVWFVYAGFLAGVAGVMGRFYLAPLLRGARAGRRGEGE